MNKSLTKNENARAFRNVLVFTKLFCVWSIRVKVHVLYNTYGGKKQQKVFKCVPYKRIINGLCVLFMQTETEYI